MSTNTKDTTTPTPAPPTQALPPAQTPAAPTAPMATPLTATPAPTTTAPGAPIPFPTPAGATETTAPSSSTHHNTANSKAATTITTTSPLAPEDLTGQKNITEVITKPTVPSAAPTIASTATTAHTAKTVVDTSPANHNLEFEQQKGFIQTDLPIMEREIVTLPKTDQLLRVHIVDAKLLANHDCYAVVAVGKAAERTKPVLNSTYPEWNEHFVIEYHRKDNKSHLEVAIFDLSDKLIGKWNTPLKKVRKVHSKKNKHPNNHHLAGASWFSEDPKVEILKDSDGKKDAGELRVKVRREQKLYGKMTVFIKEVKLENVIPEGDLHLLVKLPPTDVWRTDGIRGADKKLGYFLFDESTASRVFELDDTNNVKDLFVEVWAGVNCLGELRLPLYDLAELGGTSHHHALTKTQNAGPAEFPLYYNKMAVGHVKLDASLALDPADKPHR